MMETSAPRGIPVHCRVLSDGVPPSMPSNPFTSGRISPNKAMWSVPGDLMSTRPLSRPPGRPRRLANRLRSGFRHAETRSLRGCCDKRRAKSSSEGQAPGSDRLAGAARASPLQAQAGSARRRRDPGASFPRLKLHPPFGTSQVRSGFQAPRCAGRPELESSARQTCRLCGKPGDPCQLCDAGRVPSKGHHGQAAHSAIRDHWGGENRAEETGYRDLQAAAIFRTRLKKAFYPKSAITNRGGWMACIIRDGHAEFTG